jgi:hypothetical protein
MYSRGDPAFSRIVNERSGELSGVGLAAGLLLVAIGGFFLWRIVQGWRLARRGQLINGEVISCKGENDDGGDWLVTLAYRFDNPAGEALRGLSRSSRNDLRDDPLPEAGTPVAVLYLSPGNFAVL